MNDMAGYRLGRPVKGEKKTARHVGLQLSTVEGITLDALIADERARTNSDAVSGSAIMKALMLREAAARGIKVEVPADPAS